MIPASRALVIQSLSCRTYHPAVVYFSIQTMHIDQVMIDEALLEFDIPREDYWIEFSADHNCFHLYWYEDLSVAKEMTERSQQCVDILVKEDSQDIWKDIECVKASVLDEQGTLFIKCRYILAV